MMKEIKKKRGIVMTKLIFPGVEVSEFDAKEKWAVCRIDQNEKVIEYQGLGKNDYLSIEQSFKHDPETFQKLADRYLKRKEEIQEERKQQYLRHEISEEEFKAKIIVEETLPEEIFFVEGEEVIEA